MLTQVGFGIMTTNKVFQFRPIDVFALNTIQNIFDGAFNLFGGLFHKQLLKGFAVDDITATFNAHGASACVPMLTTWTDSRARIGSGGRNVLNFRIGEKLNGVLD